jgi:hypothetical protein
MSVLNLRSVIVCGSRDGFKGPRKDFDAAMRIARTRWRFEHVVVGSLRGVDREAHDWSVWFELVCTVVPASWSAHGRPAGPIRNRRMLHTFEPLAVLAFSGGSGTEDMVSAALAAGVTTQRWARGEWATVNG